MIFNTTSLIICGILLLLAIIASFVNPLFRKIILSEEADLSSTEDADNSSANDAYGQQMPSVSIVITAHDNAAELRRNLPLVLAQQYPGNFQVIVVAEKGDSETENALKLLSADKHLYYTLIPESSRYMSRKKLSITIGVKAAKSEWIMLVEPSCRPESEHWLANMARNCNKDKDLVIGYSRYDDDAKMYQRFERMLIQCYSLREAQQSMAYRHYGSNLMIRKSLFMKQEGFRSSLNLVRGEYDFLVNDFATADNTATETSHLAHVVEDAHTHKAWLYHHMYYLESRKILKRGIKHRLVFNINQIMLHTTVIADIAAIAASVALQQWIITAVAAVSLIITTSLCSLWLSKRSKELGENIPTLLALPLQLSVVWHNMKHAINHKFADKLDFTTHKL